MLNRRIKLDIKARKGTQSFLTKNFIESEIILPRNQKFKITDISEEENQIKITVEIDD